MDNSDSPSSAPSPAAVAAVKADSTPIAPKIEELAEARKELLSKIQNLKQELQSWRMNLDTHVKDYQTELSELKNSLNTDVEQLRTEFQELRTTLRQQQEDVTCSLKSLGLRDETGEMKEAEHTSNAENSKETAAQEFQNEENTGKEN